VIAVLGGVSRRQLSLGTSALASVRSQTSQSDSFERPLPLI